MRSQRIICAHKYKPPGKPKLSRATRIRKSSGAIINITGQNQISNYPAGMGNAAKITVILEAGGYTEQEPGS